MKQKKKHGAIKKEITLNILLMAYRHFSAIHQTNAQ